jgi:hypothetical protein
VLAAFGLMVFAGVLPLPPTGVETGLPPLSLVCTVGTPEVSTAMPTLGSGVEFESTRKA